MTDDRVATPADSSPTVDDYVTGLLLAALRSDGGDPEQTERVAGGLVAVLVAEGATRYVIPFLEVEPGESATFEVRPISGTEGSTESHPGATSDFSDALRQALAMVEARRCGASVFAVGKAGLRRRALECLQDGTVKLIMPSEASFEGDADLCREAARRWSDFMAGGPAPTDPVRLSGVSAASLAPSALRPGDLVKFAGPVSAYPGRPIADSESAGGASEDGRAAARPPAVEAVAPAGAGPVAPSPAMVEALADAVRAALADLTVEVDLENMQAVLGQMVKQVVAESVGEVAREAATAATQAAAAATPPASGPSVEEMVGGLTEMLAPAVAARVVGGLPAPPAPGPSVEEMVGGLTEMLAPAVAARVVGGLPAPPVVPSVDEVAAEVAARVVGGLPAPPAPGPSVEEMVGGLTEMLAPAVAARVVGGFPAPPVVPSVDEVAAEVAARVRGVLPAPPVVPSVDEVAAEVAARVVTGLRASPSLATAEDLAGAVRNLLPSVENVTEQVLMQLLPLLTERLLKLQDATLTSNSIAYNSLVAAVNQLGTHLDESLEWIRSSAQDVANRVQAVSTREPPPETLLQEESVSTSFAEVSQRIEASIDRVFIRIDELERRLGEARRPRPLRAREPIAGNGADPPVRQRPLRARAEVRDEATVPEPPVRRRPLRARAEVPDEATVPEPPVRRRAKRPAT